MNQRWTPRRAPKPDWRDYTTEAERAAVVRAEIAASEARTALANASAIINPIRMRACQRRLFAERAQPPEDQSR